MISFETHKIRETSEAARLSWHQDFQMSSGSNGAWQVDKASHGFHIFFFDYNAIFQVRVYTVDATDLH